MTKIELPFGKGKIEAQIPEERIQGILVSGAHSYHPEYSETELVEEAVTHPVGSKRLKDLARGKKNIVMIASDHTRPVPSKVIMTVILKEIKEGSPDAVVTVLIATGFHRPTTKEELIYKFGQEIVDRKDIRFVVHESGKAEDMVEIGILPSGGRLRINRIAYEADLLIAEGFIEPHFFAGFSGGRKSVLPGVSSRETVMANHCSEFIADEHSRTGILEGNPIHKDMVWAAEKAKLAFIVNVVLDQDKKVIRAFAGHFDKAHREGCRFVNQSVKGMTAAEATCRPGGVIIMVSSCMDGHGGQELYDTFANEKDKEKIMAGFLATDRDSTVPDQWESQILCRILLKYKVIMVTQAPQKMVEEMQMDYAADLPEALRMADAYLGKENAPITVIPDGVSVIVRK